MSDWLFTANVKSFSVLSGPLKMMYLPSTPFAKAFSYSKPETTSAHEPS